MSYLGSLLSTDDYPDHIDTLREDFDIDIDQEQVFQETKETDFNISNAYVSLVFQGVSNAISSQYSDINDYINNMDSKFYVNGDEITGKDDLPIPDSGLEITINAIDYTITETTDGYDIEQSDGEGSIVEMIEDPTSEYWDFWVDGEFIIQSPHKNQFDSIVNAVQWFIETQE